MSIADKLQELIDSKADMKSAIAEKGVEVEGGLVTYADAIRKIQQGSGEGGGSDIDWSGVRFGGSTRIPLAPNELYKCGDMDGMFVGCDLWNLGHNGFDFDSLDTSFASSFESSFESTLTGLIDFNHLDTSNVINFRSVLKDSVLLMDGYIPNWDTHNGVDFYEAFASRGDIYVTYIPQWDFSNAVDVQGLVSGLFGLVSIPKLNFSKVKSYNIFAYPRLRQPEVGDNTLMWDNDVKYVNLTDLGGFTGLKYCYFSLNMCPNLTVESIMNVINEMYDWNMNPDNLNMEDWGSNQNTAVLAFGTTNLNKLTADQIAVAIAKGWTLI